MKLKYLLLIATYASVLTACQNDKNDNSVNTQTSKDYIKAQSEFDDILHIVQDTQHRSNNKVDLSCTTITAGEDTIEVDFADGCEFEHRVRKGKIRYQFTGPYLSKGSVITVTTEGYQVINKRFGSEFITVNGEKTITNLGQIDGKWQWQVKVINGQLTFADGRTASWESDRRRILSKEGRATIFDDIYQVHGTASGVNRNGISYLAEIPQSSPLTFDVACALRSLMPLDGIISLSPQDGRKRTIDFGYQGLESQRCDSSVRISIGSININLTL